MLAALSLLCTACQPSDEEFDDLLYISSSSMVTESIIRGNTLQASKSLTAAIPHPATRDITVNFNIDKSMVDTYSLAYYSDAVLLPEGCYTLEANQAVIAAGSVSTSAVNVTFDISGLNRDLTYVLPVTVSSPDIDVLASARTHYYIFRSGALINVVPNMDQNFATVEWKHSDELNHMRQLTMEALIYVNGFDNTLNTVFGCEQEFLIRLGDSSYPPNQIQVSAREGTTQDFQSAGSAPFLLNTKRWYHIAVTFDADAHELYCYVNDSVYYHGSLSQDEVNFVTPVKNYPFQIGRSYNNSRWLNGYMCEVRVWNIIRTRQEIVDNPYYVEPDSPGLVGYWKMDDRSNNTFKDYSHNGNDAVTDQKVKWVDVELPPKGN